MNQAFKRNFKALCNFVKLAKKDFKKGNKEPLIVDLKQCRGRINNLLILLGAEPFKEELRNAD